MGTELKPVIRYSEAFKQKVLKEIETGCLTPAASVRKYGIGHCATINYWMKKYRPQLLRKVVRIEMPNERKRQEELKRLKAEKQQLESALAQSQIKLIVMETLVEVASRELQVDLKKTFGSPQPENRKSKSKRSLLSGESIAP